MAPSPSPLTAADILRVDLGTVFSPAGEPDSGVAYPVHGFAVTHPEGLVLVDTGVGEPGTTFVRDWRPVARRIDTQLAAMGLAAADVRLVVNTHLHWDHCGQNAVFTQAPFVVQRREYETAREREGIIWEWFQVAGARFELVDGARELLPGIRVLPAFGHTVGHQVVVVETDRGPVVLGGDAADSVDGFEQEALALATVPEDAEAWRAALRELKALEPAAVLLCHDPAPWHPRAARGPAPARP